MKKISARKRAPVIAEDMRLEYRFDYRRFDYRKAKPSRFAEQMGSGTIAVMLEADVAVVFKSSESVNALGRSRLMPNPRDGLTLRCTASPPGCGEAIGQASWRGWPRRWDIGGRRT